MFGVMLIDYLNCKRMNVWKHIFNQFKNAKFGLTFFQILIQKIVKTPYYIVTKVYHHVSCFLSPNFPLLLV
jgi:hypothetical protein